MYTAVSGPSSENQDTLLRAVWRKDLAGGDVAIAIVNMGALRPRPSQPDDWTKIAGRVRTGAVSLT